MQRFLSTLLVMMLYLVSSNTSAQQYDSFRHIGEVTGTGAGTVTSITLAPTTSKISYFNAAGLSTVYDVILTPSQVIREGVPVYMPGADFGADALSSYESTTSKSMDLAEVSFFTATLVDPQNSEADVPAHWFRITYFDGNWSGVFRIADRIYSIDRSQRDNVIEVRNTPSQNTWLQPTRQIKVTALIDDGYVYADSTGDSVGLDNLGHIYALESLHVMDGVLNDSLGMTLKLEQLVYQTQSQITSPSAWLADNAESFGISDNYATFIYRGNADTDIGPDFVQQNKSSYAQFATAHNFGKLLGLPEEAGTLQSAQQPLNTAHWSDAQSTFLSANFPNSRLAQIVSSDAPPIEVTETGIINEIPQHILDSEIVESGEPTSTGDSSANNGLLQNDQTSNGNSGVSSGTAEFAADTKGGGALSPLSLVMILLLASVSRRRFSV